MTAEPTGFLYPFIEGDERDARRLLDDLAASAQAKMEASRQLRATTLAEQAGGVRAAAAAMAERFGAGGRLFACGNGGSATDAAATVDLFSRPVRGRPLAALSLVDDLSVVTALANDVGFDLVFSRQVIAHARPGDMVIGFSTSGDSRNVLRALEEAARRHLLTVGLSGYEGGAMASSDAVDHCFVVRADSVHRIQEAQDALVLDLWSGVQALLGKRGAT